MSLQKFKMDSYSVGVRNISATKNIHGDITTKGSKVIIGFCSICNIKKTMTLFDKNVVSESLSNFFKNFKNYSKEGLNVSKKVAKNMLKYPRRALDITAYVPSAVGSRNPKQVLPTLPEMIKF